MIKVIMHGCNGKMGQTISGLIAADDEIEIVAGVDAFDNGKNTYPVFKSIEQCTVGADAVIDFSSAPAVDGLLDLFADFKIAVFSLASSTFCNCSGESPVVHNTQGREKRPVKEIGLSAVRGGTIVGEHDVIFAGADEVITFSHTAYSKAVFGKGAIQAAKFLAGKPAGRYDMSDVIS